MTGMMKPLALAALAMAGMAQAQTSPAADPPHLEVTYVEVPTARAPQTRARLSAYAHALRQGGGHPQVEVLSEIGRPGRLAVLERWPTGAVPDQHALEALLAGIDAWLQAPADRRDHGVLVAWAGKIASGRSANGRFHMLMHVDVAPAGAGMGADVLAAQKGTVLAAPGALGFEAAIQQSKPNHFAVHEVWTSRAAYEAYAASPAGRTLRAQLATAKGALFDDRFFQPVGP